MMNVYALPSEHRETILALGGVILRGVSSKEIWVQEGSLTPEQVVAMCSPYQLLTNGNRIWISE